MTICFFSAQYLPTPGGVERYTWNLALRCVRSGGRAIVVTSALPGLPGHETDADGIEIYRLPVFAVMGGRFPVLRPGRALRALTRQLWRHKIDFCVIQTRMYVQSLWAAWAAKRRGIPALVIDHSTGYMPVGGGLVGLAGRVYEQTVCRLIRAAGYPFYGVSAAVCRWLRSFGITAAGCLPNAVDPAALDAEAGQDPLDWRAALGLAPSTRLVAFVGRLIPEKGAAALAEAAAALPGTALVALGTGPEEDRLRAAGAHVPGAVSHARVVQLLRQADCYCLPTRYVSDHAAGSRGLRLPDRVHADGGHRGTAARPRIRHAAGRYAARNHPRRAANRAGRPRGRPPPGRGRARAAGGPLYMGRRVCYNKGDRRGRMTPAHRTQKEPVCPDC